MCLPNNFIIQERHISPKIENITYEINGMREFTRLDLNNGYHQIELDTECRNTTTFSTLMGLLRYKGIIFGANSSAKMFQKAIENIINGTETLKTIATIFSLMDQEYMITILNYNKSFRTLVSLSTRTIVSFQNENSFSSVRSLDTTE